MQDENTANIFINVFPETEKLKGSVQGFLKYFGPAFIVSVAYMDPGNFGTNIAGGSRFAYDLLWVILWSNIIAIFVQILSAKLGIATGVNLPAHCGKMFSRSVNWFLWTVATLAAMATDLAEFLGGVLGFHLLLGVPLVAAALMTGVITYGICYLQRYGQVIVERIITSMVAVISIVYVSEMLYCGANWGQAAYHLAVPTLTPESTMIAVGMLGATVMPHVIYLHSNLVMPRRKECREDCKKHLNMAKADVFIAMNMAFIVNAAMVIVAAAVFNNNGLDVDSIEAAYSTLEPMLGNLAAGGFGLALLASGLSSSTVGTMAGEVILDGFVGFDIPVSIRRIITMGPGLLILILGVNPMEALIYSQVSLSFALPAALIPLMVVTGKADIMGEFCNSKITKAFGWLMVAAIIVINILLVYLTFSGIAR